ncbi:MAG: hypothetical protein J3K34DRAFT_524441 [Monoraphidium minutum]|nr:MAG: hypothetical protein J3K34DRAFT_524441 [Monoraphidium minutum]
MGAQGAAEPDDGWEALPSARATAAQYAHDVRRQRGAGPGAAGARPPHAALLAELAHAAESAPSAPPEGAGGGWGGGSLHADGGGAAPRAARPGGAALPPSRSQADVLLLDPPMWLPDSYASHCANCSLPFKPLLRLRHHCRLCGKVFCGACCGRRLLLPPRYNRREPQRCCEMCAGLLAPLQPYLVGALSRSVQPPVHDALDAVSLRSWLNSPVSGSLEDDAYKATNILRTFMAAGRLEQERGLPAGVLRGARGLALMSVLRVGAGWSATFGTGLVVARQGDGSWSAPCAAACYGVGWGAQIGGELADVLLVLRTDEALHAFCSSAHLGLGGAASAALGPVGRCAQAGLQIGAGGGGAAVGYSCSRGAFVGVAVEGSLFVVRDAANTNFYGYQATARQLLLEGSVPQPPAASLLYDALHALGQRYEPRHERVHLPPAAAAAAEPDAAAPVVAAHQEAAPQAWCEEEEEDGWRRRGEGEREGEGEGGAPPAAAAAAAAPSLGSKAASAALRALRGAAAAGAAALAGARGGGGGEEEGAAAGFITGSVGAAPAEASPYHRAPPAAPSASVHAYAAAAAPRQRAARRPPAAGWDELRLPAAPQHRYEPPAARAAAAAAAEPEYEYEPQLTWD